MRTYTRFEADRRLTGQPNGQRSYTLAQISRPWQTPGWFITPKLQLHATQYQFDAPLVNGADVGNPRACPRSAWTAGWCSSVTPATSARSFRQTLEPRAFYVYTPFRNQNLLPNYDSALNDFNFATIYTENEFGGNDRISDSDLLTLGASTRLLDPQTGAEAARFGVAQRLRFKDQLVTLPGGTPVSERLSDLLFGATINWTPAVEPGLHGAIQPEDQPLDPLHHRRTLQPRQLPRDQRRLPLAARLQRADRRRLAVAAQ